MKKTTVLLVTIITSISFLQMDCKNETPVIPPIEPPGKQTDIEWPSLAKSPWPMFGGNPQFTGRSRYTGPGSDGVIQWALPAPGVNSTQSITSPVMGADSTIYFVSSYETEKISGVNFQVSFLYAVSQNGNIKWKVRLGKDSTDGGYEYCITSPVVLSDGSIILATPAGYVMSFSPIGKLNWVFDEEQFKTFVCGTITVGKNGDLYLVESRGELYSISKSGKLNWKIKIDNGFDWGSLSSISIAPDGNTLYVGGALTSKSLYALSTDGTLKWSFNAKYRIGAPPLVDNQGNIYFGTSSSINDTIFSAVYSLKNTGEIRWKYLKADSYFLTHAIDENGNYYFSDGESKITSLDYEGNDRWSYGFERSITNQIVCSGDNILYLFTDRLNMISASGVLLRKYDIGSNVWTNSPIGYKNSLIVTSIGSTSNYLSKIN